MIHTLSQLSSLGYCALVFFAATMVAAIADHAWKFTRNNSLAEAICALYRKLGAAASLCAALAFLIVGVLNALRLLGAL